MKKSLLTLAAVALATAAFAKLPPPDDAAKAAAAKTAAQNAWQAKVDAYQICKAQDRVAAKYKATPKAAIMTKAIAEAKAATGATPTLATASAPSVTRSIPTPTTTAIAGDASKAPPPAAGASAPATTPVGFAAPGACSDPGPFAYNAPEQKPLETSEAHSPAGNATSPPSVRPESATMMPSPKK